MALLPHSYARSPECGKLYPNIPVNRVKNAFKASIEISTETCRHPPWPDTNSCQNYQVLCCNIISHEKHVFARASRDSKGWQTTGAEWCSKMFMAVQAGKTRTTKKIYFSQAPVGSSFCEHFLLSTVQTVLTELTQRISVYLFIVVITVCFFCGIYWYSDSSSTGK